MKHGCLQGKIRSKKLRKKHFSQPMPPFTWNPSLHLLTVPSLWKHQSHAHGVAEINSQTPLFSLSHMHLKLIISFVHFQKDCVFHRRVVGLLNQPKECQANTDSHFAVNHHSSQCLEQNSVCGKQIHQGLLFLSQMPFLLSCKHD